MVGGVNVRKCKNKLAQCKLERYRLWMVYRGARLGSTSASTDKRGKRFTHIVVDVQVHGRDVATPGEKGERDESIAGTEIDTLFRHGVSGYTPSIRIRSKLSRLVKIDSFLSRSISQDSNKIVRERDGKRRE